jgi:glycosyltransferase involved in cell wall biosynthesis
VIIPAFNAERYIVETLDSLFAQTYPNIEVIVVDDGSADRTRAIIESYGKPIKYLYQVNSGGCSKPRNEGMKIAAGDLFVFIDSDDIMAPHRIATQVAFLAAHPEAALVFSNYQDFDERGIETVDHFATCPVLGDRLRRQPVDGGLVLDPADSTELLLTENFGSSSPMLRREVVGVIGEFDESLRASEDFEFQYRVAARYPIGLIPAIGWYKRIHSHTMSSNLPNIIHHKIVTRQRLLEQETVARRRRKLKRALATRYRALAYYQTGRDNLLALRLWLISMKYRPSGDLKLFARILLDVLGRDTNHAERIQAGNRA